MSAPNGTPEVNIQAPGADGVSHNVYSHFDVDSKGVILNNARTNAQTQLGGWIQGNPNLANGSARVILNEVNSNQPSQLNGYVEVGGQRAEVVIANPAGINVDGGGFINASRATLTTGKPVFQNGNLAGYQVTNGSININGSGLDASSTDYTDILARAINVNAGIWANQLRLVAGSNDISPDGSHITPTTGDANKPSFGIDVSQLGGMYAGKITLIGTEAGVGVRNAGQIGASDNLVLNANGELTNSGQITSQGTTTAQTNGIDNSGTIYAQGNAQLSANGDIKNSGRILAQGNLGLDATGDITNLDGAILGAGIQPDGTLGNSQNLTIQAGHNAHLQGENLASGKLTAKANNVDLSHSQTEADSMALTATNGDIDTSNATVTAQHALQANASGSFINDQAQTAAGTFQLQATNLSNLDGLILLSDSAGISNIALSGLFDNRGGLLHTTGQVQINANQVDNRNTNQSAQGIQGNDVTVTADSINNGSGHILADQNVKLNSGGQIDNSQGLVSAGGDLTVKDGQASRSLAITNTQGTFVAGQDLSITSAGLSGDGQLYAQRDIRLLLDGDFGNTSDLIAGRNADLNIGGTLSNSGTLQAGNTLTAQAGTVDNQASGQISASEDRINTTGKLTNRGLIDGGLTRLQADTVDNLGTGRIYGDHVAIQANDLTNDTENGKSGTIAARNRLDIGVQTLENREHGLIYSAGDMSIGGALDTNDQATGQAVQITNSSATIDADGQVQLSAQTIDNLNAHLVTQQVDDPSVYHEYVQPAGQSKLYDISQCQGIGGGQDKNTCNGYPGTFEEYTLYKFSSTTSHIKVVSSDPGKIQSGSNLILNGTLNNHDSFVVAGGDLVASQPVNNIATKGQDITTSSGTTQYTYVGWCGSIFQHHCRKWDPVAAYNPAPTYSAQYDLPTLTYKSHVSTSGAVYTIGTQPVTGLIQPVSQPINTSGGYAWTQPNTTLPSSSLFQVHDDNGNHPLIETDPRFADYRQWISSDYMLNSLGIQPNTLLKRLGDGYYEQKLVQDQVAALTGRRFLTGYSSDEAEFQALMDAGVNYAKQWHLVPGVALTAEQVAQLTSDMVWLVAKDVHLPNGKTERVLVPQVYAATNPNDPGSNGSLISANRILTGGQGTWTNSGTIAGRKLVSVSADNIDNLGGKILGATVSLSARKDINNIGGSIVAGDALSLNAGRDINVVSTHRHDSNKYGASQYSRDSILNTAQLKVGNSDGVLLATAGRDLVLTAAKVDNAGTGSPESSGPATQLEAGRDIRLDTLTSGYENHVVWDADNHDTHGAHHDVGSSVHSVGDLAMIAGHDIQAKAAQIGSDNGSASLQAGHDIQLTDGQSTTVWDEARKHTSHGLFSSGTSISRDNVTDSRSVGTQVNGQSVQLSANHDITLQGSKVSATGNIGVFAGDNISVMAGRNVHSESHYHEEQKSGLTTKGYGKSHDIDNVEMASVHHVGSSLHSSQGNIALAANLAEQAQINQGSVLIEGSQLKADHGRVDVSGKHVILSTSQDQEQYSHSHQSTHSTWAFVSGLPGGMRDKIVDQRQKTTVNGSTLRGQKGVGVQASGLVDMTAAHLKASQGDIDITGAQVAIRSGINQQGSSHHEEHKKIGANWRDLTGLFTPGKGVGFHSTLDKKHSQTTLANATLNGQNIHIQSTQGDITLAAVQAKATGTTNTPSDGSDGAPANSPGQISLKAAGNIHLASVSTETYQRTDEKHKDKAWQEVHGNGRYDQQTHYNHLTAGQLDLQAGGRITADMSVRDSAAVLAQSPDMAWLRQLQQDPKLAGKVDWKKVEEAHKHWKYKQQGMTPAAAAVVSLVVAYFTLGAGSAIVDTAAGSTTAAASGAGAVAASMTQAAVTTMASKAAVGFINNGGDLGKTLNDLGSKQSMRQLAMAVVTAGVLGGIGKITFGSGNNTFSLDQVKAGDGFMENMGKNLVDGVARATVNSAITGTNLETNIRTNVVASILGAAEAQGANWIGGQTLLGGAFNTNGKVNEFAHEFAHAIVGCAAGAAGASASGSGTSTSQGCGAGALGAVVGEMSAQFYGSQDPAKTAAFAQMMSGIAAAAAGLGSAGVAIAANTGANAAQNNYLAHADAQRLQQLQLDKARGQCGADCQQEIQDLQAKDVSSDQALAACKGVQSAQCDQIRQQVRDAAAGYARSNDACVGPGCGLLLANDPTGSGTVEFQSGKTQQLALGTMSGTTIGNVSGVVGGIGSAIGGTADLVWTGIKAIWDPTARGQLSANFDALGSVITTPSQWKYVAGALTPSQREQLAQDYESGNGYAASKAIGERNFNVLATVMPGSDVARGAEAINDGAKIGKAVDDVSNGSANTVPLLENKHPNSNPPEHPDYPITSGPAPEGARGWMAVEPGQINPITGQVDEYAGAFLSDDPILSIGQVRKSLAVPPAWKANPIYVQEFKIVPGARIQKSIVGPQQLPDGTVLPGLGRQTQIIRQPGQRNNDVLIPVGPAKLIGTK